ncbi:MAG: ABC transporter ATP-binding protein [bacterium]
MLKRVRWYMGLEREKVYAVRDISFTVGEREIFGILGPNGSGKSTLIRMISTLLLPDSGVVEVFGHDVVREPLVVRRLINRVSVEAAFFKKLSAYENLMYAARLYGVPPRVARKRIVEILDRLGLKRDRIRESLENLSRGMQQKVAIARAFLTSPILLLLDEPTTGLDPKSKRDVQEFIGELRDQHNTTILLTTHDMSEADRICQRIAIMDRGRFIKVDTPAGLKDLVRKNGREVTLEDVFLELTGKGFEEEEELAEVGG